jgi:hypothetical protein
MPPVCPALNLARQRLRCSRAGIDTKDLVHLRALLACANVHYQCRARIQSRIARRLDLPDVQERLARVIGQLDEALVRIELIDLCRDGRTGAGPRWV